MSSIIIMVSGRAGFWEFHRPNSLATLVSWILEIGAVIFTAIENLLAASSSLGSGLSFGVLNVQKDDRDEKLCSFWVKLTFFACVVLFSKICAQSLTAIENLLASS